MTRDSISRQSFYAESGGGLEKKRLIAYIRRFNPDICTVPCIHVSSFTQSACEHVTMGHGIGLTTPQKNLGGRLLGALVSYQLVHLDWLSLTSSNL